MIRNGLLLGFILLSGALCAQFLENLSGSLDSQISYYIDDEAVSNPGETDLRSNNYLQFNYFNNQFEASLQFESYFEEALLGYSPQFDQNFGLSMASLAYKTEKIGITGGYFLDQFGSGMMYRSWEDRQLGLNNAILGGQVNISFSRKASVKIMAGKQKNAFEISNGTLIGFYSEIQLSPKWSMDLGYLGRHESFDSENPDFKELTNLFSSKLEFEGQSFYSNLEFIYKSEDALVEFGNVIDSRLFDGNALLFNAGYYQEGLGIDATFRRIENMLLYSDREKYNNIYNELLVNYLPALTKQHNFGLSNIYVYQAQAGLSFLEGGKAGEIGQQIDLYYRFSRKGSLAEKYKTVLSFNYSGWYALEAEFDLNNRTYESSFLEYGEKYYQDINLEITNQWAKKWRTRMFFMRQYYNMEALQSAVGTVNASILALESKQTLGKSNELRIQLEHLWTPDDTKNWVGGLVEYHFKRKFSIYLNDQYNYGNDNSFDQIHYYNIGGTFRQRKTRIGLNYGRQRGGLICVGGVCRFVPKSNGLTLSLNLFI